MTDYLIGIDAGGTKTRALAYRAGEVSPVTDEHDRRAGGFTQSPDEHDRRAGDFSPLPASEARSGPGNLTSDPDGAARSILEAARECSERARRILGGRCLHISLGAAGFSGTALRDGKLSDLMDALASLSGEAAGAEDSGGNASGEKLSGEKVSGKIIAGENAAGEKIYGESVSVEKASGEILAGENAAGEPISRACLTALTDAELALHANFASGEAGMIVIAGTGSAAFLQLPDHSVLRAGGWGSVLGDGGSGWSAAREGVRRLLALLDEGRGDEARAFFGRWRSAHLSGPAAPHPFPEECAVPALIAFVTRRPKKDLSRLACGLVTLYESGDPDGIRILTAETGALASDCARLLAAAGGRIPPTVPLPVVLIGGFFESNPSIRALFRRAIASLATESRAMESRAMESRAMGALAAPPLVFRELPADPTAAVVRDYLERRTRAASAPADSPRPGDPA